MENRTAAKSPFARLMAVVFASILLSLSVIWGCSSDSAESSASADSNASTSSYASDDFQEPEADDEDITVSFLVSSPAADDSITYDSTVLLVPESTVIDAFDSTALNVTIEDSSYGPFVVAINGLANEGTKGWTYTLNGEQVQVAASEQLLADGDRLEWSYIDMAA